MERNWVTIGTEAEKEAVANTANGKVRWLREPDYTPKPGDKPGLPLYVEPPSAV